MLARALPYAPPGVHLAVVDPEVGARRRAVALRTALDDRLLVGPDNGLLLPAAERFGWVTEAVEISTSPWRLEPVSATFHGRDLFAPVAARLAAGEALADAGTPLDPDELVRLELPEPRKGRKKGQLVAHAMVVDGFGNVQLDARPADLEAARLGHEVAVGTTATARATCGPSPTPSRASCCSTRTPPGCSRSPSTAARRTRSSAASRPATRSACSRS